MITKIVKVPIWYEDIEREILFERFESFGINAIIIDEGITVEDLSERKRKRFRPVLKKRGRG